MLPEVYNPGSNGQPQPVGKHRRNAPWARSYREFPQNSNMLTLLLLMTVAAQALLALVRCYLMTFTFLTTRHNVCRFKELLK
jgi:hypothetical protein